MTREIAKSRKDGKAVTFDDTAKVTKDDRSKKESKKSSKTAAKDDRSKKDSRKSNKATDRSSRQPLKEVSNLKNANVVNTVFTAGVFKHKGQKSLREKKSRHRDPTPEPRDDILEDFCDGLQEARASIQSQSSSILETTHVNFMHELKTTRAGGNEFLKSMRSSLSIMAAPLGEEQVQTITEKNGEKNVQIVQTGEQIRGFRATIEAENIALADYWRDWEELGVEYLELGVEFFGAEKFGKGAEVCKGRKRKFDGEMELLDSQLETQIHEIKDEVIKIGVDGSKEMWEISKNYDRKIKKEQLAILTGLMT